MLRRFAFILVISTSLAGCGSMKSMVAGKTSCLSEDGQSTAISVVKEAVQKQIANATNAEGEGAPRSKIRAALEQIKFVFEDVRTTKEDPNSTKKFCSGKLKVSFPAEMIEDADKVAELTSSETIEKKADELEVERNANSFSIDVDFNVQPTDDGEKVYSEVENAVQTANFISQIVTGHLFRKPIEQAHREAEESARAQKEQEQAALNEQRQASYDEAKATYDLAVQSITTSWQALPSDVRERLLPLQRAWIARKDADCKVEAAGQSTDPTEREVSRLQCQTRLNNERTGEIKQLLERANADSGGTF